MPGVVQGDSLGGFLYTPMHLGHRGYLEHNFNMSSSIPVLCLDRELDQPLSLFDVQGHKHNVEI